MLREEMVRFDSMRKIVRVFFLGRGRCIYCVAPSVWKKIAAFRRARLVLLLLYCCMCTRSARLPFCVVLSCVLLCVCAVLRFRRRGIGFIGFVPTVFRLCIMTHVLLSCSAAFNSQPCTLLMFAFALRSTAIIVVQRKRVACVQQVRCVIFDIGGYRACGPTTVRN